MLEAVRACAPTLADARLPSALLLARFSVLALGDAEGDQSEATTVPDGSRSDGSGTAGRVAGGELVVRSGAAASEAAAPARARRHAPPIWPAYRPHQPTFARLQPPPSS